MGAAAVAAGILALWVGGDLVYSRSVAHKLRKWEAGVERDAGGIREGCKEFTVGTGEVAILLVHGFGDSPGCWRKMAPALAEHGFACRAMRLPGFAMAMAEYRKTTRERWAKAVQTELTQLRQEHRHVFIVAHSLGAACAIDVLIKEPAAADGLIAIAPLIGVSNARSPLFPARTWFRVSQRLLFFTRVVLTVFEPDIRDTAELKLMKVDKFIPRQVYREMFALLDENRKRTAELTAPLLMILSKHDQIIDLGKAESFWQDCSATPKALEYASEAHHAIPLDTGWEEAVERTRGFIRDRLAALGPDEG